MNVAFLIISAISVVLMIARAPEAAFPTMIDGVTHAIELSIKLCAIYAVWLSVLKMVEATSLDKNSPNFSARSCAKFSKTKATKRTIISR